MNIKEDALSNKLEHLDVLCFPTLFPSGRFGEFHDHSTPISLTEYAKSRLLNKDSIKTVSMSFISCGKRRCVKLLLVCTTS